MTDTNSVFSLKAGDGQCGIIPPTLNAIIKRMIIDYYGYVNNGFMKMRFLF